MQSAESSASQKPGRKLQKPSRESQVKAQEPQLKRESQQAADMEADFLKSLHETRVLEAQLLDALPEV